MVPERQCADNLKQQYISWLSTHHQGFYSTPSILSWPVWLRKCWIEFAEISQDSRIILSSDQRRLVWDEVIKSDAQYNGQTILWNHKASISQALNAWEIVHNYFLQPTNWSTSNPDTVVFVRWYVKYLSKLKKNNWLDPMHLSALLIQNGFQPDLNRVILSAEALYTPYQQQWLDHLKTHNRVFNVYQLNCETKLTCHFDYSEFASFEQEIEASALWAKNQLIEHPDSNIALVIPNLATHKEKVNLTFRSVFVEDLSLKDNELDCYEFATRHPLNTDPLINCALNCLQLCRFKFDYVLFSQFLNNVYLRQHCRQANSLLDAELRQSAQTEVSILQVIELIRNLKECDTDPHKLLLNKLNSLASYLQSLQSEDSPANWCNHFSNILQLLGWPDLDKLDHTEQASLNQWQQILAQMCTLGLVKQKIKLHHALSLVSELASRTSAKSNPLSTIKIISLDDVVEARFDQAWVLGLNDSVLPQSVKINPLIPIALQRKHSVSLATNTSALHYGARLFNNLANLADQVIFSYFKADQQCEYRVSPFLKR